MCNCVYNDFIDVMGINFYVYVLVFIRYIVFLICKFIYNFEFY